MPRSSFELTTIVPVLGFIDRYLQEKEHVGQYGNQPAAGNRGPGGRSMSAWMMGSRK
jgi:hypothetical protein